MIKHNGDLAIRCVKDSVKVSEARRVGNRDEHYKTKIKNKIKRESGHGRKEKITISDNSSTFQFRKLNLGIWTNVIE